MWRRVIKLNEALLIAVVAARDSDILRTAGADRAIDTSQSHRNVRNLNMNTFRTRTAWTAATAAVLLVAACGGVDDATDTNQKPLIFAPTTTPGVTVPTGVPENSRGAIEKQWRELAAMGCNDPTDCDALFALDPPTDATGCWDSIPAANGQLKAFSFTVQTGSNFDPTVYGTLLNSFDFAAIRANGYTLTNLMTDASINCDEADQVLPTQLAPRSMFTGFVVLDLPPDATSIAYRPAFAPGGWEWQLNGGVA